MYKFRHLLCGLVVLGITACGSSSGILEKDVNQRIGLLGKRDLRCYVVQKEQNVLVSGVLEACQQVFTMVDSRPYDIKVIPEFEDYTLKTIKERFKAKGNDITCEGTYHVAFVARVDVYDADNNLIKTIKRTDETTVDTYAFALRNHGKKKARARAHRNAAGKANV